MPMKSWEMRSVEEMERDNELAWKLDAEYIEYLTTLRLFINGIPNSAQQDVHLYRAWLHRLTNGPANDRYMRNIYMAELCRQLQRGRLADPFCSSEPPAGPLPPRTFFAQEDDDKDSSSMWSDVTDTSHNASMDWQTITEGSSHVSSVHSLESTPISSPRRCSMDHSSCLQTQRNLEERIADLQGQVNRCQRAMDYCVMNGKSKEGLPRIDDLDSKLGSLYEKKLQSMISTIEKLKFKNEMLNKEVAQYKKTLALGTATASSSITNLNKEIGTLVQKIDELEKIKAAMEANHQEEEAEHRQLIAGHLQDLNRRLTDADKKNCDLQNSLQEAWSKCKLMEIKMADRETEMMQYWQEKLLKEAGVYEDKLTEMKRGLSSELNEQRRKNEELSSQLITKSKEVMHLNDVIKDQCLRMKDEMISLKKANDEKESPGKLGEMRQVIAAQKRNMKKLERLKTSCINEYERKIMQMELDKDVAIRKLQFEVSTQRAKLALSFNRGQLENEVLVLEERYKLLFDTMVETSLKQRQEDLKKIRDLEDILLQSPNSKTLQTCKSVIVIDTSLAEGKSVTVVPVEYE